MSASEEADDYRAIVALVSPTWRVIECRSAIQWILQRRLGGIERVGARWRSESYHRARPTLLEAVARRCAETDPAAMATLQALPDMIEKGSSK